MNNEIDVTPAKIEANRQNAQKSTGPGAGPSLAGAGEGVPATAGTDEGRLGKNSIVRREKNTTSAQLEANRQNAQKSTGPRTPEGKAASKMNALKHGVLASSTVVSTYKFRESARDFKQLCHEFYEALAPVGPVEEILVDRIIMVAWRQRRLHIAESSEIAKAINDAQSPEGPDHREMLFLMSQTNPSLPALPDTVQSCRKLCEALQIVRESIERNGLLEADEVEKFYQAVGRSYAHFIDEVIDAQSKIAEHREEVRKLGSEEAIKQQLLAALQTSIREAESRLKDQLDLQSAEQKAKRGSALLPSPEALDKIVRYEAGLERQLYRALNQLERLQRIRQGETVPAPVSIIT